MQVKETAMRDVIIMVLFAGEGLNIQQMLNVLAIDVVFVYGTLHGCLS